MADLSKTVEIIFDGTDRTGKTIGSVGRNLDTLTNKVGSVTGPLADVTDSIVKLDAALAAAALGVTGYAVKISDDFDTAFSEIATLIDQPADNLRDFQAQILEYSTKSTASLSQITQATYSAISAGTDYRNSLDIIAASEQLAVAGRADLDSTTVALVSTLNAFGAEASEASKYADDFFTAVRLGQTTVPELADTIGRIAPIAKGAGISFGELAAAIATVTAETGSSTKLAVTGLRAAIAAIIKPTKEASDTAKELGIEFNASALESKGFAGVMKDVKDATGGSTELLGKLFGSVESLPVVFALAGTSSKKFNENLKQFEDNAGAASRAADQLQADLDKIVQTLKNNVNAALIAYGSRLTDETQSIVKSITSVFNSLATEIRLDDGVFKPILDGLEGLAQDIDQKLQVIAQNFPEALSGIDLTDLLAAFSDLGDELGDLFTGLFGDVDLSTVEGLQEALQKVVDAFTALVNVFAGIANGLEPLFIAIGKGIEKFQSLDESSKKSVGELLGIGKAINTILPAIGGLAGGLSSVGTGLTALAGAQGFKAVIGNLNTIKGIASTTVGKGGLLGLALTGGYALGSFINDYFAEDLGTLNQKLFEYFNADELQALAQQFAPATGEIKKLGEETEELRKISQRYDEMNKTLGNTMGYTTAITEEQRQEFNRYAQQLVDNANKTKEFTGSQREVSDAVTELNRQVEASGGALGEVSKTTQQLAENNKTLQLGYDEATGKVNSFSGTIIKSGKALDDQKKKTEDLVKKTTEFQIALEKFASNERIAVIESKVKLDIAEVEANADRVKAIANTISDTFSDTGKVISGLFGGFDDASRSTQIDLAKQIRQENEFRKQALDDQSKLTQAEVEYIKQKTQQLANGESLLTVKADGLAPHLEAIWFDIIKALQARVNAEGEEMLLGLRS